MIRQAAAAAIALCLGQVALGAQGATFTVDAPSAEVHRGPSTGSPVIGTARRGAALEVTRDLGSWVSVAWPDAPQGEAFVHVSRGALTRGGARLVREPADAAAVEPSMVASDVRRVEARVLAQSSAPVSVYTTPSHAFGVGAALGGRAFDGFGASGRVWRGRLGIQLSVSRHAFDSPVTPDRLTALQVEPGVLYSLRDHVSDFVWIRPYAGSGVSVGRRTLRNDLSGISAPSESLWGVRTFGGAEITFASLPRFALSTDLGYRWVRTPPAGFDVSGTAFSLAAHWYLR
jgi:hypothetical protein